MSGEKASGSVGDCPKCGQQIPEWAPDRNCPACLFGAPSLPSGGSDGRCERIGGWILREPLGEGAFGIVHRVEQLEPVQRTGAMKILRPGLSSAEMLARFESECQALALLDHPDIVTVHEVGSTEDERPYLVMEFVEGVPVTELASDLSREVVLDLFDRICASVAHAHQCGIIHRDLKPANILVSEEGPDVYRFKLLDFGIALSSGKGEFDNTFLTSDGQFLGTPEYMSPEQSAGDPLDVRTDVFSLGVVLYEMLAGRTPRRISDRSVEGLIEFFRQVREEEPDAIPGQSGKDLDAILRRAMHPDREQRYSSVGELRDDLRRFREKKPIRARRPDRLYIATRFLQRHWKVVLVASLFAVTLAGATVLSLGQMRQAQRAEAETRNTLAETDYFEAVERVRAGDIAGGIDFLVRSLKTKPDHREASRLFRGVMECFEIPEVQEIDGPSGELINFATVHDDSIVVVTEAGAVRGNGKTHRVGGSHHRAEVDPSGRWMSVAPMEGGLHLYDFGADEITTLTGEPAGAQVLDVAFSDDSQFLCAAVSPRRVARFDLGNNELKWEIQGNLSPSTVAVSADGNRIMCASATGLVALLEAETGEQIKGPVRVATPVRGLLTVDDERCLLVGTGRVEVRSFADLSTLSKGVSFKTEQVVYGVAKDAPLVAVGTEDQCFVWDYDADTVVFEKDLEELPVQLAFADGMRPFLSITGRRSGVEIVNFRTGEPHAVRVREMVNPVAVEFARGDHRFFVATRDARYFEIEFGEGKQPLRATESANEMQFPVQAGESLRTFSGESVDAGLGYAGYRNGMIRIWRSSTDEIVHEWKARSGRMSAGDLSPDGSLFAWRDSFRIVKVRGLVSEESDSILENQERDITSLRFSADSKFLASANYEGVIRVAPVAGGASLMMRHQLFGEPSRHFCHFSPDGSRLLSWGASDRTVRVWDLENNGEEVFAFPSKDLPVSADMSPDRSLVAILLKSSDSAQIVELRSTRTGELVFPPTSCRGFEEVRFSEKGDSLVLRGETLQSLAIPSDSPIDDHVLSSWKSFQRLPQAGVGRFTAVPAPIR